MCFYSGSDSIICIIVAPTLLCKGGLTGSQAWCNYLSTIIIITHYPPCMYTIGVVCSGAVIRLIYSHTGLSHYTKVRAIGHVIVDLLTLLNLLYSFSFPPFVFLPFCCCRGFSAQAGAVALDVLWTSAQHMQVGLHSEVQLGLLIEHSHLSPPGLLLPGL